LNLLADANLVRSMGSDWRLTWDGHEFLKSAVPNTFEDGFVKLTAADYLFGSSVVILSKYPPAKPVALICEPLKAANRWR